MLKGINPALSIRARADARGCLQEERKNAMYVLAINHAVTDYEKWKTVYDSFPPTTGGGAQFARLNRSVDDPNLITIVAGFASLDQLKAFVADPTLKERMHEAGVVGQPRIEIYEEVEVI